MSEDCQLKSVKVTLHSHHHSLIPPKQRSWIHALIGQHLGYTRLE